MGISQEMTPQLLVSVRDCHEFELAGLAEAEPAKPERGGHAAGDVANRLAGLVETARRILLVDELAVDRLALLECQAGRLAVGTEHGHF